MLSGMDADGHLAGVSNDPIGNEFEDVTEDINRFASVRLAEMASLVLKILCLPQTVRCMDRLMGK